MKKHVLGCGFLLLALALAGPGMQPGMAAATLPQESIATLQKMMADGEISSEQLTTEALNAAVRRQQLNAFIFNAN